MKALIVLNNLRVANGVATTIMNQYDELINNGYDVDFVEFLHFSSPHYDKIKINGGRVFTINKNLKGVKNLIKIINRGQYDIIHINQVNSLTVIIALMEHFNNKSKVIFHSHNTKIPRSKFKSFLHKLSNLVYVNFSDTLLACSNRAGKDSFGKKDFIILNNAIDVKKFSFNIKYRNEIRKKYNITDDTLVVGTVCRYARQKNPKLMIEIINCLIENGVNVKFLWVGSAPSTEDAVYKEMIRTVNEFGISDRMIWVGSQVDVYKWYSAMDVFIMPSLWEGLGITYIEAQSNSLPTFASDVVPSETKVTGLIRYFPLDLSPKEWANEISKCEIRGPKVKDYYHEIKNAGYDLESTKSDLLNIYNNIVSNT